MRLLDANFEYVPSAKTNVAATWRRFGFRPTTEAERRARQRHARAARADRFASAPRAVPR